MTVKLFNPHWFYQGQLSDKDRNILSDTYDDFISDNDNFHNYWEESCNNLTSFRSSTNNSIDWNVFKNCLYSNITEFINEMKPRTSDVSIKFDGVWINKYKKGAYQEVHDHATLRCNLVMVYIYKSTGDECFTIYNPDREIDKLGLDYCFDTMNQRTISPSLKTGDILIFPSHYHHMVKPNLKDEERITISSNFFVRPSE
tara:strand:- start:68 stop:667 length:600 start_codon:yes stop_codon:yes gene_type:complete